MKKCFTLGIVLLFLPLLSFGQVPKTYTSSEIHHEIKKFNTLGIVLYVAAHPDDENTRLISYLANQRHLETNYISFTRGGGGQNLIGPELGDKMGVIRTQELLEARRIDGGRQFFARTRDFGFSKNPEETFGHWGYEESMSDMVWAVRKLRPDVVINRFDHRTSGRTHGHHTATAVLAYESFDISGDAEYFPYQLNYASPWQPKRLFFNTSWWFYGSREAFEEADKSNMVTADIGVYFPLLGESNSEIAGRSRSMHRCQGFGTASTRGSQIEYMEFLNGIEMSSNDDIFEGIEISWNRVDPSGRLKAFGQQLDDEFDHTQPHLSVPVLLEMKKLIHEIEDEFWKEKKLDEIRKLITLCSGLFLETTADRQNAAGGELVNFSTEVTMRSGTDATLKGITYYPAGGDTSMNLQLEHNIAYRFNNSFEIPHDADLTTPYWLIEKGTYGMQQVDDVSLRGSPETAPYLFVNYELEIHGQTVNWKLPVIYKYVEPAIGEVYERFDILPVATVGFMSNKMVFGDRNSREIEVSVRASKDNVSGVLELFLPDGWQASETSWDFDINRKGQTQVFTTKLTPPDYQSDETLKLIANVDGREYDRTLTVINYDYIPLLNVLSHAEARAVRVDIEITNPRIAYIMGAGDNIPAGLRQIGYQVDMLQPSELLTARLDDYAAVVTGIRAYNTIDELGFAQDRMLEYVERGGILIAQYTTPWQLRTNRLAPYDMTISRFRVTDHEAEMRFLAPDHQVLNYPNKITDADFEGWVQERGLYFAGEWGDEFTAIFGSNDPNEPSRDGSLVIAQHGEGFYVYTGLSFFRQIPAGVPGSFRLFANILSLSNDRQ